ncbi:MAG: cyclic nucleotide-binding domain-containing protein [Thermodesulfobacteriota bacterium]
MKETPFLVRNEALVVRIREIPALSLFEDEVLLELLTLSKMRHYEAGEVIFKEDTYDLWIYFLICGQVRLTREGRHLRDLRRRGDVFGEMSIIDGAPRSATATAVKECDLLAVDASLLDRLDAKSHTAFHYVLYRFFSELLAERLRDTNAELVKLKKQLRVP